MLQLCPQLTQVVLLAGTIQSKLVLVSNPIIRREDALPYIRPMGRTAYDVIKGSSLRWLMMQLQEKRSAFSLLIIGLLLHSTSVVRDGE